MKQFECCRRYLIATDFYSARNKEKVYPQFTGVFGRLMISRPSADHCPLYAMALDIHHEDDEGNEFLLICMRCDVQLSRRRSETPFWAVLRSMNAGGKFKCGELSRALTGHDTQLQSAGVCYGADPCAGRCRSDTRAAEIERGASRRPPGASDRRRSGPTPRR